MLCKMLLFSESIQFFLVLSCILESIFGDVRQNPDRKIRLSLAILSLFIYPAYAH